MIQMRGELNRVAEATRTREQEIRFTLRARGLSDNDERLVSLRLDNERVQEDLEQLAFRLAEIGSTERETRREGSVQAAGAGVDLTANIRPVTARMVGQNFIGGAQFNDLNAQLGAYFGTDRGVLVIQVMSGTPCDDAGLIPGDVVTHVAGTEIASVEAFRTVLNGVFARRRQAELTLLRRGQRMTATLSR
jgi:S1-C subfamily serine protease